jgi:hypothetical protein
MALNSAITEAIRETEALVAACREEWAEELQGHLAEAAGVDRAALEAMAGARERLVAKVRVAVWLARFPEGGPEPPTVRVPANPDLGERDGRTFNEILRDLRRDGEQLPAAGPPLLPVSTALDKAYAILEHVDGEGQRHPRVYRGGTPGQHPAWESIARIKADVKERDREKQVSPVKACPHGHGYYTGRGCRSAGQPRTHPPKTTARGLGADHRRRREQLRRAHPSGPCWLCGKEAGPIPSTRSPPTTSWRVRPADEARSSVRLIVRATRAETQAFF